jgi:hypothetical protein
MVPVLSYDRAPARPEGGESVRVTRHAGGVRVSVFAPGPYRGDFLSVLLGNVVLAGVWAAATVWYAYHPVSLVRYAGAVWPLGLLLLCFLGMLAVAYDQALRQVEFEVEGGELLRLSYGPFGVRRRRWDTTSARAVKVVRHVSGSHPRVVLITGNGRTEIYSPGTSSALSREAEQLAGHLRLALGV